MVILLLGFLEPRASSQALRGTGAFRAAAYRIGSLRIESLPPPFLWNRKETQYAGQK